MFVGGGKKNAGDHFRRIPEKIQDKIGKTAQDSLNKAVQDVMPELAGTGVSNSIAEINALPPDARA
jgi:hypothetical protein